VTRERDPKVRLLRWYPPAWRERYGEEFVALLDDDLAGREPSVAFRLRVAASGVHQRARGAGLVGAATTTGERQRAGSLVVLVAWSFAVLAGATFAKASEHFSRALRPHDRLLPQVSYDLEVALAGVGALLVVVGALSALPAFARFVRGGGWPLVKRRVVVAGSLTLATLVGVGGLAAWAHLLGVVQRNGGDLLYTAAFLMWALLVASSLASWTIVAVACARRVTLSTRVLRLESRLAVALSVVMIGLVITSVVWWMAMSARAPWYFQWSPLGSNYYAFNAELAVAVGLMSAAAVVSLFGVYRVVTARRARAA
jgi:hypothetical protein